MCVIFECVCVCSSPRLQGYAWNTCYSRSLQRAAAQSLAKWLSFFFLAFSYQNFWCFSLNLKKKNFFFLQNIYKRELSNFCDNEIYNEMKIIIARIVELFYIFHAKKSKSNNNITTYVLCLIDITLSKYFPYLYIILYVLLQSFATNNL